MAKPLTRQAHDGILPHIKPDSWVIDATAGNGFDSLFLARQLKAQGRLFAFDIQALAIQNTLNRLAEGNIACQFDCVLANHAAMSHFLPTEAQGKIDAVMFNLGYLPGNNHNLVTQPSSTIAALQVALTLLSPNGILSILAYRGHPEGVAEYQALRTWLTQIAAYWQVAMTDDKKADSPVLIQITPFGSSKPSNLLDLSQT